MPPAAPVTIATLLDWMVMMVFLRAGRRSSAADEGRLRLPSARIISHDPSSLFGGADNGSLRRNACVHPHRRAAQLYPGGRRPGPAPLVGDRRGQGPGGAAGGAAAAADDAPGQ